MHRERKTAEMWDSIQHAFGFNLSSETALCMGQGGQGMLIHPLYTPQPLLSTKQLHHLYCAQAPPRSPYSITRQSCTTDWLLLFLHRPAHKTSAQKQYWTATTHAWLLQCSAHLNIHVDLRPWQQLQHDRLLQRVADHHAQLCGPAVGFAPLPSLSCTEGNPGQSE